MLARIVDRPRPHLPTGRRLLVVAGLVAAALAAATVIVAAVEGAIGLADASPVYFVAIVLVGSVFGTWPAVTTGVLAFVLYDLLFTEPRLTLIVDDPHEWLDLVVFLVIAVVVGRLSALGTERAIESARRATEAADLFAISRLLATAPDVETAAPLVTRRLVEDAGVDRVWLARERPGSAPRILGDTHAGVAIPSASIVTSLVRMPDDTPAHWVRAHEPSTRDAPGDGAPNRPRAGTLVRVKMEADGVTIGSLKAILAPGRREPDRTTTRLLSLAADQLALAIRRDDLRREATEAEIARRADALKSALLDAVSHDLRTPLASIRAAAGSLTDPDVAVDPTSARATAAAIDLEADRLDRLVREVLDLSRIEGGSLRPTLEALVLGDAVTAVVDRLRSALGDRPVRLLVPDDLPPVRADAVLLDGIVTNLVENVARHAPAPAPLEIRASVDVAAGRVVLHVDDGGPGLSEAARGRLFTKFEAPNGPTSTSRPGLGLGLAIVRGMAEVMGGTVAATRSPLGGLRIELELPIAAPEPAAPGGFAAPEPDAASAQRVPDAAVSRQSR